LRIPTKKYRGMKRKGGKGDKGKHSECSEVSSTTSIQVISKKNVREKG